MESLSVKEARNKNQSSSSKGLFLQSGEAATGYIVTSSESYGTLTFTDPDNYFSIYDSIKDLKIKNPEFGQVIVRAADEWTNGDFYYSVTEGPHSPPQVNYSTNKLHMDEITINGQLSVNHFLNDYSFDVETDKSV